MISSALTFRTTLSSWLFATAAIWLALLLTAPPALATAPAPTPEQVTPAELDAFERGGPDTPLPPPPSLGPWNFVREFAQMCEFFATWQVSDPQSPSYGGMIEAESGPLGGVIQTDNTLEAIWCWSRFREFTGRDTYDDNIAAAWIYCRRFPAWLEEGAVGEDYYRVHNCAWGLEAVQRYQVATGDPEYAGYADTCAQYIQTHPLDIHIGNIYFQRLNTFVKGWAAGNLYIYGEAQSDPVLMAEAVTQGTDVFNFLDANPALNLTLEYWAMSSGTVMWGVCNSVFRDDPALGASWCAANAGYMDVWQEWYSVPGYDWDSSWNVAYCNAAFAVWEVTGDDTYYQNGVQIADWLLSLDTDDDGGIVAETMDPDTEDMTWVSCYLVKMGVDRLMGGPFDHDVGTLRFVDLDDGDEFTLGDRIDVAAVATNYGLSDETGVEVHLDGDAGSDMVTVDMPFAYQEPITFIDGWIPPASGSYTLLAWTEMPGDQQSANDTISVTIEVLPATGIAETGAPIALVNLTRAQPNPFRASVGVTFGLEHRAPVALEVFDVAGRLVNRIDAGWMDAGDRSLAWDGRDTGGRATAPGTYLYRLRIGDDTRSGKMVRLR